MADSVDELTEQLTNVRISASKERKTNDLILELIKLSAKNPKLVKSTPHEVESVSTNGVLKKRTIRSWKMNEYKYSTVPAPFPTLARGLFTECVDDVHRVVARGYDKFFNMNEVPWNSWEAIGKHTEAPYHLTVKSNGCIIFMAALTPTEVIVMSKHSLGGIEGHDVSHAQMGEKWLDRHLEGKGKKKTDFAKRLWDENITAVAELCDDDFEEHVLPYTKEQTGLHLHGINKNQGAFETYSPADVNAFAEEWGFIQTSFVTLESPQAVKKFTDEIGETGKWNGYAVEGFVVRTHVVHTPGKPDSRQKDAPPYPPGSDYFFKIKFDEPYMTYRDWRELTKMILTAKRKGYSSSVPKSKLRRPESHVYRAWVEEEIDRDPKSFEEYNNGKGIIAAREKFLKWLETKEGQDALRDQGAAKSSMLGSRSAKTAGGSEEKWEKDRVVIVPVAVPGSGKTVVGLALRKLFGFGHTQSDDIKTKKTAQQFKSNIVTLLKNNRVVFADRNNHLVQHRKEIRDVTRKMGGTPVKLLALNWGFQLPLTTIHRICSDRILDRGENHQSLRGDETKSHEEIIWQFINGADELSENEVDRVIEMNLEDTPEQAVQRVVDELVPLLGLEAPSKEQIQEACAEALAYSPTVKKDMKTRAANPRYFGVLVKADLSEIINEALETAKEEGTEVHPLITSFWTQLHQDKRVANRPHITVVHKAGLPEDQELWERCQAIDALSTPIIFKFRLSEVLTDGQVMAVTVEEVEAPEGAGREEAQSFITDLPQELRNVLHITVGTANDSIKPYNAKTLVEKRRNGEFEENDAVLPLRAVKVEGAIRGLHG